MSINKFVASLVLAGILGATAVADEVGEIAQIKLQQDIATQSSQQKSGFFVGVQFGMAQAAGKLEVEATAINTSTGVSASRSTDDPWDAVMGSRFGIVAGYNQFFTDKFGLRYYGVIDFGQYGEDGSYVSAYNLNANVDALYNFFSKDEARLYVFGGAYLGYTKFGTVYNRATVSGVDVGLNLGLQIKVKEHHNIDIYGRFGFLEQSETINASGTYLVATYTASETVKIKQPFQIGVRYTYSF